MKIAVGLSGGLDSAVTALLLQREGHEVFGVTMTLGRAEDAATVADAAEVAGALKLPFQVFDLAAEWQEKVLGHLKSEYLAARTPNPCVRCNELVKFGVLPQLAFAKGAERFATGHYARLGEGGRLFRGADRAKDQSYFLYRVRSEILARTLFPLGGYTKAEVREIAAAAGLAVAERGDSQDFCGGAVQTLIDRPPQPGHIVTTDGKVLGEHSGYWNYTIGKRKGLGIGGGIPFYVLRLDAARNEVVVGTREELVRHHLELTATVGTIDFELPVKIRSTGEPRKISEGLAGVAPGQSAVFYKGDEVVGGGIIR